MLDEADASINGMKAYNKAMKVEQRKVTWLEIYLFTILAFGCLFGGIYA